MPEVGTDFPVDFGEHMNGMREDSITPDQVMAGLEPFGIRPSAPQIEMIREYVRLLIKWNRSISLTTIEDPFEIVSRHFGESIFAVSAIPLYICRLADVGTGAGFPGLALKIIFQDLNLLLIESNNKKCAFLSEVVRALGLTSVEISPKRFEEINESGGKMDIIAARALGGFPKLLRWTNRVITDHGKVVLWVGLEDVNTISATGGWAWEPAIKIPESQRRYLLIGRPTRER